MVTWLGPDVTVDQLIFRFAPMLRAQVVKDWARVQLPDPAIDVDDLQQIAVESMIRFASSYHAWCEEHSLDPDNTRIFYHTAKKRARWDIIGHLEDRRVTHRDEHYSALDDSSGGDPALLVSELRSRPRDSWLHKALVEQYSQLPLRDQLLLALRFYEEFSTARVGDMLGCHTDNAARDIRKASKKLLLVGSSFVLGQPLPRAGARRRWSTTARLDSWTDEQYGTTPEVYTRYVSALMHMDVSYLVDALDQANGLTKRRFTSDTTKAAWRSLTDDQVRAIRARALAGDRQADIAAEFGINRSTVSAINRGDSYSYVA